MRKLLLSSVIMLAMSAYVHAASLLASVEGNWAIDNTFNCSGCRVRLIRCDFLATARLANLSLLSGRI